MKKDLSFLLLTLLNFSILASILLIYILISENFSSRYATISFNELLTESGVVIALFAIVLIFQKLYNHYKKVYIYLVTGAFITISGSSVDIFKTIYNITETVPALVIYARIVLPIGIFLLGSGLIKWINAFNSQQDELLNLNKTLHNKTKKLKNADAKIKKKNSELEKTLEDFYTMRVEMEQEMTKGKDYIKKENAKIKKRINELKKV